jgi:hypothetical protein
MKAATLLFSLLLPLASAAQKFQKFPDNAPPKTYRVGSEKAPLYRNATDTTGAPRRYISPGWEVTVVGEFTPHWAVVTREGFLFITPTKMLAGYNSASLTADRAADAAGLPISQQTGLITYEGVVDVPNASKADLYTRAYAWVANAYHSANAVVQMQDKDAGQLIIKGLTRVSSNGNDVGVVRHTLSIYVKDGRYKYILTNLNHEATPGDTYSIGPLEQVIPPSSLFGPIITKKVWANIRQDANRDAYRLVAELQAAMTLRGAKDPRDF